MKEHTDENLAPYWLSVAMTSKERMLRALVGEKPDRLPVSVHQWSDHYLNHHLGGIGALAAYKMFGLDAAVQYYETSEQFWLPVISEMVMGDEWKGVMDVEQVSPKHRAFRCRARTPEGFITYAMQGDREKNCYTVFPIKELDDLDMYKYRPVPLLYKRRVTNVYDAIGDAGILRGAIWGDQPGCWQHATAIAGLQNMTKWARESPDWVHGLLKMLLDKKLQYIGDSLEGANFDVVETGGFVGGAVNRELYEEFCLPYDCVLHSALHRAGHKVIYRTFSGVGDYLDLIATNNADAIETLDTNSAGGAEQVYNALRGRCALVGGMDVSVLQNGTPTGMRKEVTRLFEIYGKNGGYIMSTAAQFFAISADSIQLYADTAHSFTY